MNVLHAIVIAIVEGLTEFLPISSTGHMILAASLMGLKEEGFVSSFEISIQLGAIMAIVFMYAPRFITNFRLYPKLVVAFLPSAVLGVLVYDVLKRYLFDPVSVALALIAGGVVLVLIDRRVMARTSRVAELQDLSYQQATMIGLAQCVSLIPGVSRAAATIIGGVFNGLDKRQAMEFSFLLAIPTMLGATAKDLFETGGHFTPEQFKLLGIGLVVAFVSAWLAVKVFLGLVERFGFKHFGWYRIILGFLCLLWFLVLGRP
jgi:undecaprenyl-diphosphatase